VIIRKVSERKSILTISFSENTGGNIDYPKALHQSNKKLNVLLINCINKMTRTYLIKAFVGLFAIATLCSCEEYEDENTKPKSAACEIISFSVNGVAWDIDGADITYTCPSEAADTSAAPVITLSAGATINPSANVAQNFFVPQGVTYTVTAEDGSTTKTFVAKATVQIASGTTGDCIWTITGTENNYTVTFSGNGAMANYDFDNEPPWASYMSGIKTAVIQDGVTNIADGAFYECAGLTAVNIPNSVTIIGHFAFYGCAGLTSVSIGNSVTVIGNCAFRDCVGLTVFTVPTPVTTVGEEVFESCENLTAVNISASVTLLDESAFEHCPKLTAVNIDAANPNYTSENGVMFNKNKTTLIFYPQGKTGSYVVPLTVHIIQDGAFFDCGGLTEITISDSVETVGIRSFAFCSGLVSIVIPNSVTTLADESFEGCEGLTSVTLGSSVTAINYYAFSGCTNLTTVANLNPVPQNIENSGVFSEINLNACTLKVPETAIDLYKDAAGWKEFGNIIAIP
jgi:hypothetical protein